MQPGLRLGGSGARLGDARRPLWTDPRLCQRRDPYTTATRRRSDWANEFRPVRVIAIMSFECVAGGFVGAGLGLGVPSVSARRKAFFFAVCGAALGVGLGWVLTRVLHVPSVEQLYGSELIWNLIPQAVGALAGFATSFSGQAGGPRSQLAGSGDFSPALQRARPAR